MMKLTYLLMLRKGFIFRCQNSLTPEKVAIASRFSLPSFSRLSGVMLQIPSLRNVTYLLSVGLTLLSSSLFAEVKHIDNQTLQKLLAENVPIIDIRRAEEWQQTGVVENSHLLTFFDAKGRYDLPKWLAALEEIAQKDEPFILICRTGNRTNVLSNALDKQLGYKKVYNVKKGITDWKREGLPVVSSK